MSSLPIIGMKFSHLISSQGGLLNPYVDNTIFDFERIVFVYLYIQICIGF